MKQAIICDIDGTLAIKGKRKTYDFKLAGADKINPAIHTLLQWIRKSEGESVQVIMITGREEQFRSITQQWLDDNNIFCTELFMREDGDNRADDIIKLEILDRHIRGIYDVQFVLDDRDRVVKMWREQGLTCLQVAEGNF